MHTIVSIGEVLWDLFPDGPRPGGAPCNVAYHAVRLGNRGAMISRVGQDSLGTEILDFLDERGVETDNIQIDGDRPTGTVLVAFVDGEPFYTIVEDVAWDYVEATRQGRELVSNADPVCFGSLAQRNTVSRRAIHDLLGEARGRTRNVFDVNLRPPFVDVEVIQRSLALSDIVKLSRTEISDVSAMIGRANLIEWLLQDVGVSMVCVTHGPDGASITTTDGTVSAAGVPVDTSDGDAVGVGDSFVAAMTHKLVSGAGPETALQFANRYAALVATRRGAMPTITSEEVAHIDS